MQNMVYFEVKTYLPYPVVHVSPTSPAKSGGLIKTSCHERLSGKLKIIKPKFNYHTCSLFAVQFSVLALSSSTQECLLNVKASVVSKRSGMYFSCQP